MILVQVSPLTPELIKEALRNNYDKAPPHPADDKDGIITYPDWSWKSRTDKKAVIVDRICAEAVLKGANIFVNGIRSQNLKYSFVNGTRYFLGSSPSPGSLLCHSVQYKFSNPRDKHLSRLHGQVSHLRHGHWRSSQSVRRPGHDATERSKHQLVHK